jgi:hypothetical protein
MGALLRTPVDQEGAAASSYRGDRNVAASPGAAPSYAPEATSDGCYRCSPMSWYRSQFGTHRPGSLESTVKRRID